MRHPWVWLIWLITILVMLSTTRNPLYLALILMCVGIVWLALQQAGSSLLRPVSLWKLSAWIILLATLFNALTSHYGDTVLLTIPGKITLISGRVTLEAVMFGAINGLVLTGMLASFSVLNLALPVRDLISLIPRAFFPVAVVSSIAVTYLPTTVRQFQQIREAQSVRGHRMRDIRDWLPLLIPLLVGGLEHAMQLAEAMTARGFARTQPGAGRRQFTARIIMLIGLVLLAFGWILQLSMLSFDGMISIGVGVICIIAGLWYLSQQSPRSVYRHHVWHWLDWVTVVMSGVVLCVYVLPIPGIDRQALFFNPYPKITLPLFDPWIGITTLGLLIPAWRVLEKKNGDSHQEDNLKRQLHDQPGV